MFERLPVTVPQLHIDLIGMSPAAVTVAVTGEVDMATATTLRDRLLDILDVHDSFALEVDLAAVTFLDCAGLRALVAAHSAAVQTGRQMWIINPRPIVRRMLDASGLLTLLSHPHGHARSERGPTAAPMPMLRTDSLSAA